MGQLAVKWGRVVTQFVTCIQYMPKNALVFHFIPFPLPFHDMPTKKCQSNVEGAAISHLGRGVSIPPRRCS